jgi:hypothetical protein
MKTKKTMTTSQGFLNNVVSGVVQEHALNDRLDAVLTEFAKNQNKAWFKKHYEETFFRTGDILNTLIELCEIVQARRPLLGDRFNTKTKDECEVAAQMVAKLMFIMQTTPGWNEGL